MLDVARSMLKSAWFSPASASSAAKQLALDSKPLFQPDPLRGMFSIANREMEWQIGSWQRKNECFVLNGNSSKN
jgi:hypothetical protein